MAQKQSTDHNSDADTDSIEHRKNVVGALFEHFKKWHPQAIKRLENRSTETDTETDPNSNLDLKTDVSPEA